MNFHSKKRMREHYLGNCIIFMNIEAFQTGCEPWNEHKQQTPNKNSAKFSKAICIQQTYVENTSKAGDECFESWRKQKVKKFYDEKKKKNLNCELSCIDEEQLWWKRNSNNLGALCLWNWLQYCNRTSFRVM